MIDTILFDLGNTLVRYYEPPDFPPILDRSIVDASNYLKAHGCPLPTDDILRQRVAAENHEAGDFCVRPLEQRLSRIFSIENTTLLDEAARHFLAGILDLGQVYTDTVPALEGLRLCGYRIGIVSNTPWGSPSHLWRQELQRLGLAQSVHEVVFCTDVGWRKPAPAIFDYALQRLSTSADRTLFVGDDPHWDVYGPLCLGMKAVLLDRSGRSTASEVPVIQSLNQVSLAAGCGQD